MGDRFIVIKTARGAGKMLEMEQRLAAMRQTLEQVTRERDAAVNDLALANTCCTCKYYDTCWDEIKCRYCVQGSCYEWRGPYTENGGEP